MVFLCKYFVSYMIRIIIWKQKYVYCMGEYSFIVDIYIYIYIYHMNRIKLLYRCVSSDSYMCIYIYIYIYWLLGSIRSNPILASSKQIHTHTHTHIYI